MQRINVNGIGRFHYTVYINPLVIKQDARLAKKANLRMDFLPINTSSVASYQSVASPMKFYKEPKKNHFPIVSICSMSRFLILVL
jgi:hypothetical protein